MSMSQIFDRSYHVDFMESHYKVINKKTNKVVMIGYRHGNIYEAELSANSDGSAVSLIGKATMEES